jgi:glycosyltransferase involved in cell wall biosynthesis
MDSRPTIALAMIAKDKADIIERALDSTKAVFDFYALQDTGSTDSTIQVFQAWCERNNKAFAINQKFVGKDYQQVIVDGKPTLANFAQARNDSFSLIPSDIQYSFWIDTDDVIQNAEQIPQIVDLMSKNNVDMSILEYIYAKGPDNLKPVKQERERVLNLKKKGAWGNWVHENYKFQEQVNVLTNEQLRSLGFSVVIEHLRTPSEALATNRRNNMIMKLQLELEGLDKFPDEMLSHLGYDHWEHREWDESIKYYELLLTRYEGLRVNPEAIHMIYMKLATAYQGKGLNDRSIQYGYKAIEALPNFAEGYLHLARLFAMIGNWDEVMHYVAKVEALGVPQTTSPINEYDYYVAPLDLKLKAYLAKGMIEEAIATAKQLINVMPTNPTLKQQLHHLSMLKRKNNALRAVGELSLYYQENNKADKLDRLQAAIPTDLLDDEVMRNKIKEIRHDYKRKSRKVIWSEDYQKSISIYAGAHIEQWDGESDVTKGIGGSEGMCIQLARELAAIGNKVIVYNECGASDGKEFDGVTYLDHRKWSADTMVDVFISLRRPDVFAQLIKATKQYLWLHDTGYGEVPLLNFYSANKVIVLTEFHKEIIKLNHGISDDKIFWITRNALNSKAIEYADKKAGKRDPMKLIYSSSYDRGLDHALEIFAKVKKAVPEATLDIYYGWSTFDGLLAGREQMHPQWGAQLRKFKSDMVNKIANTPGVRELGRISQSELYKKTKEAGIWFYPTQFEEISCITAMQAQALGAIPVCTPFAELNETVNGKYGVKANLDQITEALIYTLKEAKEGKLEKKRESMMKWARDEFDMKKLAKQWSLFFNQD